MCIFQDKLIFVPCLPPLADQSESTVQGQTGFYGQRSVLVDEGGRGGGGGGGRKEGIEEMKHSPRWFQLYRQQGEQAVKTGGFERPLQPNLPIAIQEVIIIFVSEGKDGVELCKKKKN